ncbi:MAG: peptide ABC transporter substrate-binding protein, partial [Burkholderiaceae bacterium]
PWSFGFYPWASTAAQNWVKNSMPAILIRDHGRYLRLDIPAREAALAAWNKPRWWPLALLAAALVAALLYARRSLRQRERLNGRGEVVAA